MNILPLNHETFDGILNKCHNDQIQLIVQILENYDRRIAAELDRKRWKLIKIDERTIYSSFGVITYKHRYYYDNFLHVYTHPLDNFLSIPKNIRYTNELRVKVLKLASELSYSKVGENISKDFTFTKSTIYNIVKDSIIESYYEKEIDRCNYKVHVQIDEKYIGFNKAKYKKRYYTLTIFAGKKFLGVRKDGGKMFKLLNKTCISSCNLSVLKERVNELLVSRYHVLQDEEIFLSGDLANYIQNFKYDIKCCYAKYVPDKFHIFRTIKKLLPNFKINEQLINHPTYQSDLIDVILKCEDKNLKFEAEKILRLLRRTPEIFLTYLNPEYLGCSQECQNSHIYAPRFGKYANRFNPETIEKLSLIREAKVNNSIIKIGSLKRIPPRPLDFEFPKCSYLEKETRYVLDTREMKYETQQMFNRIKYGDL